MKILIAILMLGTMAAGQQSCDNWLDRVKACFHSNVDVAGFFDGSAMLNLEQVCSNGQMRNFSTCFYSIASECNLDFYDIERMKNGYQSICQMTDFSNCQVENQDLNYCVVNMKESWKKHKSGKDEHTDYCNLFGGIKSCLREKMMCSYTEKFVELLDTFSPRECSGYTRCRFCPDEPIQSAATITTTSLVAVVGAFVLYRIV